MTKSDQAPQISTEKFDAIKFRVCQRFGNYALDSTTLTVERAVQETLIGLESHILGQYDYQKYTVGVRVPATWWDHFRQDVIPKWFVKKYPIKYTRRWRTVEFNHKALFPKCDVRWPSRMGPVVFHTHTNEPDVGKI